MLSKFFSRFVEGLGYTVGVEDHRVSGEELAFANRAFPLLKKADHRACGIQPFESVIAPEEKSGKVTAIGVAQAPRRVVVFAKEERGERSIGGILAKKPIDGLQQSLRLLQSERDERAT